MLKFRNYQPTDEALESHRAPAKPAPSVHVGDKIEKSIKDEVKSHTKTLNIAPVKANADLKRDIEKKLRKLARRTHRAIRELVKERLEAEKRGEFEGVTGGETSQID